MILYYDATVASAQAKIFRSFVLHVKNTSVKNGTNVTFKIWDLNLEIG
jgi:hypothetical protein